MEVKDHAKIVCRIDAIRQKMSDLGAVRINEDWTQECVMDALDAIEVICRASGLDQAIRNRKRG